MQGDRAGAPRVGGPSTFTPAISDIRIAAAAVVDAVRLAPPPPSSRTARSRRQILAHPSNSRGRGPQGGRRDQGNFKIAPWTRPIRSPTFLIFR